MEIPEYDDPAAIPRIRNTAYWPFAKYIPVLSEAAIKKLQDKGVLETGLDIHGEDTLKILINNKRHPIPRYLTSKQALLFLGLTKRRVDTLWEDLLKVTPPFVTPSIYEGGQHPFWMEIKLWLADEIDDNPKRSGTEKNDEISDKVLNKIGLDEGARLQSLMIEGANGPVLTSIQEQKPQDILPLVQRLIYHRWLLLAKMEKAIIHGDTNGKDWWTRLSEEITKDPINLDELYGLHLTWRDTIWKSPAR